MKKQSLIKGSLILGVAGILTRFLGIFFRWPLIMLIGDEGVGYYQMSYPLYMFFIALASGIPMAVSKIVSEKNAIGKSEESFMVMRASLIIMLILGTGMTIMLGVFAKPIISFLKWDPKAYYSLIGICLAPILIAIMTAIRGFFQGLQNMTPSAISQVIEQIGRVVVGVGLAFLLLPYGIEYAAGGAAFGAAAGGLFGGVYLFFKYLKVRRAYGIKKVKSNSKIMDEILRVAIPISMGATVGAVMSLIDSILVPQKLLQAGFNAKDATILYAQLTGKATVLTNIPLTLSVALSVSLIPIIAEKFILKDKVELERKIDTAMKFSFVIAIPCFLGLYFMAEPVMRLIFPGRHEGYTILKYLSISIPFIIIAQTTTAILQAIGHYVRPVINLVIGCVVKIILTLVFVPMQNLNVYGAVIATIGGYVVASVLNMICLHNKLKVSINYKNALIKPSLGALAMINIVLVVYYKLFSVYQSNGFATLISIFCGIIIYVLSIVILGVFSYGEIKQRLKRPKKS